MHALILIAVYLAVTLTPLVLSVLQGRAMRPFWDEISSGLAMTAFAIVLVEFVLSGRFKVISARIGMDVSREYTSFWRARPWCSCWSIRFFTRHRS